MILPSIQIPQFMEFARRRYGAKWSVSTVGSGDESARFYLPPRLVLIRMLGQEKADSVEVWCNDKDFGQQIENDWNMQLIAQIEEMDDGAEAPDNG